MILSLAFASLALFSQVRAESECTGKTTIVDRAYQHGDRIEIFHEWNVEKDDYVIKDEFKKFEYPNQYCYKYSFYDWWGQQLRTEMLTGWQNGVPVYHKFSHEKCKDKKSCPNTDAGSENWVPYLGDDDLKIVTSGEYVGADAVDAMYYELVPFNDKRYPWNYEEMVIWVDHDLERSDEDYDEVDDGVNTSVDSPDPDVRLEYTDCGVIKECSITRYGLGDNGRIETYSIYGIAGVEERPVGECWLGVCESNKRKGDCKKQKNCMWKDDNCQLVDCRKLKRSACKKSPKCQWPKSRETAEKLIKAGILNRGEYPPDKRQKCFQYIGKPHDW